MASTLLELKQQRGKILEELEAMKKAVELRKTTRTKDERDRATKLLGEDDGLKSQVAELEADQKHFERIAALQAELGKSSGRRTDQTDPAAQELERLGYQ